MANSQGFERLIGIWIGLYAVMFWSRLKHNCSSHFRRMGMVQIREEKIKEKSPTVHERISVQQDG
eukprot:scaffold7082_cov59-Cylindrotheca_fusiformis.AAC.1